MNRLHSDRLSAVFHADCLDPAHAAEIMAGQRADALIFDAPFSAKTHAGHKGGLVTAANMGNFARRESHGGGTSRKRAEIRYAARRAARGEQRRDLNYEAFDADKIAGFCRIWLPLCAGWIVSITDDVLAPMWSAEFTRAGLYTFAPLPLVEIGGRVRMSGDGPSAWTCWIVVARPRGEPYSKWGTLPGAYVQPQERGKSVVGGKPMLSMSALVRDYSRRGDLIVDPFCGGGTTIAAAKQLGRRALGIDCSLLHAHQSAARAKRTREQLSLLEAQPIAPLKQLALFEEPAA